MTDIDYKLDPHKDKIKTINTNEKQQVESLIFEDGSVLRFKDFIEQFKFHMRCLVAGEIVTWEDHWRFTKQTDAKSFDMYLDNVEQEGILKGSRGTMTGKQKSNILLLVIIIAAILIGMVFLYVVLSKGGIKLG
jgi:hypothetical protein